MTKIKSPKPMVDFIPTEWMKIKIKSRTARSNLNKATVIDAINNYMLQVDPNLMAELLFYALKLVGRSLE